MMGDSLEDALMSLIMTSAESPGPSPADVGISDAFTETAQYDRETCGRIIGPGGVTIKSIREQSGCKVVVSNESVDGMQTVSLAGTETQVRAAKDKLSAIVAEGCNGKLEGRPTGPPAVVTQLFAKSQVSRLIGPGGATIRRLRDTSRAFIKIDNEDQPPPPGTTEPCQQLRVTGTDAQVQVALALIHEILSSESGGPKESTEGKHEVVRSVAKDQVRRLIGQGGATIRKLRDTSRAFIKIDNDELPPAAGGTAIRQQLRIIGTDVQVATALQLITDILTDNPTPNAAPAAAPALGCGAWASAAAIPSSTITATGSDASLSSSYSSSTSVPSADSGSLSAASTAAATSYVVARMIPKEQARRLIGPGGATIRRLRDASRAFIKIDNEDLLPSPGTNEPCQQLRVTGTELQVQVALGMIDELLASPLGSELPVSSQRSDLAIGAAASEAVSAKTELQRVVPKSQVSRLIGPGGATIRRLRDASRAFIKIDNEDQPPAAGTTEPCQQLRVTGTELQVHLALALINEILSQAPAPASMQDVPAAEVTRVITKEQARRLIGPGGATIRRMRDTSRAFIKIDNDDLPPLPSTREPCQQLRITGTDAQVQIATSLIDEVLVQPLAPMSSLSALEKPPRSSSTSLDAASSAMPLAGLGSPLDLVHSVLPPAPLPPPPPPPTSGLFPNSLLPPLHLPPYNVSQPFPYLHHHTSLTNHLQQHAQPPPLPPHPPSATAISGDFGVFPLLSSCNLASPFSTPSPISAAMSTSSSWLHPGLQTGFTLPSGGAPAMAGPEGAPSQNTYGALDMLRHAFVEPCSRRVFDEPALQSFFVGSHSASGAWPAPSHQPPFGTAHPLSMAGQNGDHMYSGGQGTAGQPRVADVGAPCASNAPSSASASHARCVLGHAAPAHCLFPHGLLADFAAAPCISHKAAQNHSNFLSNVLNCPREPSHTAPITAGGGAAMPSAAGFQDGMRWW